jgi:hypothetical protein|tara:strand:- start:569 stop:757 length:189 start_codon:yes stop_codon:yes gene_type:complete
MKNIRETKEWQLLFAELEKFQLLNQNQDIITITGFFTTIEELENHVWRNYNSDAYDNKQFQD